MAKRALAPKKHDTWGEVSLGLITVGICALAPWAAYEVLYRCDVPEIKAAILDQSTRSILFLYITIGTVFTASFSSFLGSLPTMLQGPDTNIRRILATLQCLFSFGVIVVVFLLGPPGHRIDLAPFVTESAEWGIHIPNHYLSYLRLILAIFGSSATFLSWIERKKKS